MNRLRNLAFALALTASLGGCFSFTQQPTVAPASAQQTTAYAYAQIAGLYNLLADLVDRGRISVPEAQSSLRSIDELRTALDVATATGNASGVQSVTQGLIAIETTLKARSQQ